MLVFKYLLRVFKHLTTAYNNHPVKKNMHRHCAYISPCLWGLFRRSKTHV